MFYLAGAVFPYGKWHTGEKKVNDDIEEPETVVGYECLDCGHRQANKGFDQCDKCGGPIDPLYE